MKINIFNIFSFLKENKLLVIIKTKLIDLLKDNKDDIKQKVNIFVNDKSPAIQEKLVNFIADNISLPFYLKPFKFIIKKTLNKNIDKIADFILDTIDKI